MTENEAITKNILGVSVKMQFAGKPWKNEKTEKSGITKENISITKGNSYVPLSPIELLGIMNISKDEVFMKELNRRALTQEKELKQIFSSSK